ncbi:hypothetical protein WA026_015650 [Henosepilachna vigintioctopunctata]|uniref:Partial AB-hydrolase lipase domain-containing protein n=1 Tax=Henosepilachna vigintioctopunctata TaxID=420089 RepID=A0AAW1VFD0_9CUCU
MWLRILLYISICEFLTVNALPFMNDVAEAIPNEEYLHAMPYSREEIRAVRKKLNLTLENDDNADEYLSVPEIITKYGYPVEEHFVHTKDGYILRMHRIPATKPGIKSNNRVVFLMHGILSSSADWIIIGPQKALSYHLANLGYDVWMGNARGNTQSRNHTKWHPSQSKFWKFSWHEIGTIDMPAMIDYVLETTKQKALYHIGHSQGTTSFYVMCSELPQYNKKIIAHYSLAPIAYMKHAFSPILRFGSKFVGVLEVVSSLFGINELLPQSPIITKIGNLFCQAGELTEFICKDLLFAIVGFDDEEFDKTLLPTIMGHSPAGSSARQIFHYAQLFNSGGFKKYDYAPFNLLHYGILHPLFPPSYDLKKVKAPVYLYYSLNDWLSDKRDVARLCNELGNCRAQTLVSEKTFNHLDYLLGIHAKERVYDLVSDNMSKRSLNGAMDIDIDEHNEVIDHDRKIVDNEM